MNFKTTAKPIKDIKIIVPLNFNVNCTEKFRIISKKID